MTDPETQQQNPLKEKFAKAGAAAAIRTPKLIIVLGTNGTGKTTFVKKLLINELKKKDSHVLVTVPDDMEWGSLPYVHPKFPHRIENYVGARKVIYFDGLIDVVRERFRNGMVIFDDCRAYWNKQNAVEGDLHSLLIRRRQQMIDICAVGHGFTEVPPKFFTFATHYALFKTIDNIVRRKNVINNFEVMKEAQERINQKALTNPHYFEIIPV
jgi:Cdc6-like AAA superfamily ATPase